MYAEPIVLIQEGVSLDFNSESPITTAGLRKTKCTVFARKGELIFLHGGNKLQIISRLVKGLLFVACGVFILLPEEIPLSENVTQILLYTAFGLYALLPKLLKTKTKTLDSETVEKLSFEGGITRLYWRELLSIKPPARGKSVLMKPAELDQGYQKILLGLSAESFQQTVAVVNGEIVFEEEKPVQD